MEDYPPSHEIEDVVTEIWLCTDILALIILYLGDPHDLSSIIGIMNRDNARKVLKKYFDHYKDEENVNLERVIDTFEVFNKIREFGVFGEVRVEAPYIPFVKTIVNKESRILGLSSSSTMNLGFLSPDRVTLRYRFHIEQTCLLINKDFKVEKTNFSFGKFGVFGNNVLKSINGFTFSSFKDLVNSIICMIFEVGYYRARKALFFEKFKNRRTGKFDSFPAGSQETNMFNPFDPNNINLKNRKKHSPLTKKVENGFHVKVLGLKEEEEEEECRVEGKKEGEFFSSRFINYGVEDTFSILDGRMLDKDEYKQKNEEFVILLSPPPLDYEEVNIQDDDRNSSFGAGAIKEGLELGNDVTECLSEIHSGISNQSSNNSTSEVKDIQDRERSKFVEDTLLKLRREYCESTKENQRLRKESEEARLEKEEMKEELDRLRRENEMLKGSNPSKDD